MCQVSGSYEKALVLLDIEFMKRRNPDAMHTYRETFDQMLVPLDSGLLHTPRMSSSE